MIDVVPKVPLGGLLQLLASVVLLSSAWPLTKIALAAGSTPLWFAEGRAVLSGLTACVLLLVIGRLRCQPDPICRRCSPSAACNSAPILRWRMRRWPGCLPAAPRSWRTQRRSAASWWALAYIGLVAGPLGTWCVMEATAKLPALVSSVGFLTTPAVSLILANIFLHEKFTPDLLAGAALIMAGVAFAAWPQRRTA